MELNKNKNSKATKMEDAKNHPEVSSLFVKMLESKKLDKTVDVTEMRIKNINRYLKSTQNYRSIGLLALTDFLELHSVVSSIFTKEKDCQEMEWIELMLKMIDQKQESIEKCFSILNKLLIITTQNPEMHKIIQGKFIQKIIETITSNPASIPSFETLITCLKHYSGTSGIYKNKVYDFSIARINSSNVDLVKLAGISLHLIQQTRGGSVAGSAYKKNWAEFHEKLLNTIDEEFNQLLGEGETLTGKSERLKLPELNFNSENKSQMLIYTQHERFNRFKNLCIFLESGLLQAFPAPKIIQVNRIISRFIDRGCALNQQQINKKDGDSQLPYILHVEIQKCLINVLRSVILAVGGHIQIHSKDVSDILWKCLKSTNIPYDELKVDGNFSLRSSIYVTLNTFLRIVPNNHFIFKNMENFMKEAFVDITPIQNEITLTLPNDVSKSKKKKKKETEIRKNVNGTAVDVCLNLHQMICGNALEFLRSLLTFCGAGMKPVLLKILQEKILLTTFKLQSLELCENDLYNSYECRSQMLELCYAILMHPAIRNVTPMSYSVEILTKFKANDRDVRLRQRAGELIRILEAVLHNRKDSIHYPSDLHEFRDSWLFNEKTVKAFKQLESEMWKKQQVEIVANGNSSVNEETEMVVDDKSSEGELVEENQVVEISDGNDSDIEEVQQSPEAQKDNGKDSDVEIQDEIIPPVSLSPKKNVRSSPIVSPIIKRSANSESEAAPSKIGKYSEVSAKDDIDEIVDSYLADFDCT